MQQLAEANPPGYWHFSGWPMAQGNQAHTCGPVFKNWLEMFYGICKNLLLQLL